MKQAPYPWNPHGAIPASIEHLFVRPKDHHRTGRPPWMASAPKSESKIVISKSDPARFTQISKARI